MNYIIGIVAFALGFFLGRRYERANQRLEQIAREDMRRVMEREW